jgi:hypothetical protein
MVRATWQHHTQLLNDHHNLRNATRHLQFHSRRCQWVRNEPDHGKYNGFKCSGEPNGSVHSKPNPNAVSDAHTHSNSYTNANTYTNPNTNAGSHAKPHPNSVTIPNTNPHTCTHSKSKTNANSIAN